MATGLSVARIDPAQIGTGEQAQLTRWPDGGFHGVGGLSEPKAKEAAEAQRATTLLRKFVRPATTLATPPRSAKPRPSAPAAAVKSARTGGKPRPIQLALPNLTDKAD